jgi:hypothetical protein
MGRREKSSGGARIFDVARADAFLLVNFRVWPDSAPFAYRLITALSNINNWTALVT